MDEIYDSLQLKRIVFVTVGTTSSDSLVREALFKKGYTHLLVQMGRGSYIPMKIIGVWRSTSLVISQLGSIFETLRLRKPQIVVVNEDLMDNVTIKWSYITTCGKELHLFCARPQTLFNTISEMDNENLIAYEPYDALPIAS